MYAAALLVAWCAMLPLHASASWTNNLRATLANYAYYKTTQLPSSFLCTSLGKAAECCNCWNYKGDHGSGQTQDFCNQPSKCLAKKVKHSGGFKYAKLKKSSEIDGLLKKWKTPSGMKGDFKSAVIFDSATFATFSLKVTNKGTGKAEAHVGAARRGKDYVYVGWVYGTARADLITPRIRTAKGGNCKCVRTYCPYGRPGYPCPKPPVVEYNFGAGTKKRGFRSSEVAKINDGLLSYGFADAARAADKGRRLLRSSNLGEDSDEGSEGSEYVPFGQDTSDDSDEDPDEGFEGSEYVPFTSDETEVSDAEQDAMEENEKPDDEALSLDVQEAE